MSKVLELNDMNKLTPHCYDYKCLNDFKLQLNILGRLLALS